MNIIHYTLFLYTSSKAERPDGTLTAGSAGLSLFAVPAVLPNGTPNGVTVTGLNHKMGWRGTPNCVLALGDCDGAVGWRIDAEGQGLPIMFQMMNEARIGVGIGAATLAWRGYLASPAYVGERRQGRPLEARDSLDPVPLTRHLDVRRMHPAQKAEGKLALCLYAARLVDQGRGGDTEAEALLGLLTPLAMVWPSETGLIANQRAIQNYGSYGYTRDFDAEQINRDNRLNFIHEGTSGIKAVDLLGRKILFDRVGSLDILLARIVATEQRATGDLSDFTAMEVLSAAGQVTGCWLLLDSSLIDDAGQGVSRLAATSRNSSCHACPLGWRRLPPVRT